MFIVLPLIAFLTIYTIFHQKHLDWREFIPLTTIIFGIIVTLITEFLSLVQSINFVSLLAIWFLVDIVLISIYFRFRTTINTQIGKNKTWQFDFYIIREPSTTFLICSIFLIVAIVGAIAIIAPPNNWDSMDYHMSRVVYWIQNHSIAHYPTSYTPQLYQNPWSEFFILHLQILSGGDYFANLVQWLSMISCIIIVSLIAKQLGAELRGQVFAAVVVTTIPMGILQASSTQNDYVLALWLTCLAYYTLLAAQSGKKSDGLIIFILVVV